MKIQLVGSEEVSAVTRELTGYGSVALTYARSGRRGDALDNCDNIRHTLYYLTDLMRAELTSNKAAVNGWHRRSRPRLRRLRLIRRRDRP